MSISLHPYSIKKNLLEVSIQGRDRKEDKDKHEDR